MPATVQTPLISTDWLASHMDAPDLRIVDATYFLPFENRNAKAEYTEQHIPSAVYCDIDDVSDETSSLPHMVPDPVKFASRMRKLGIGDGNRVIVYDRDGFKAAARLWWMMRYFGHEDVFVLDGGLNKWVAEDRPTSDLPPMPRERHFTARVNQILIKDLDQVAAALKTGSAQIIDARPTARFTGEAPEPREGIPSGHMPGAVNIPHSALYDPASHCLQSEEALKSLFLEKGIDLKKPMITSCGSGVTAANVSLALAVVGVENTALYDGSWAEWGQQDDAEIVTGP